MAKKSLERQVYITGEGGRKWFSDDWINMQNTLLEISNKLLEGVGNCVVAGIEATGTGPYNLSEGIAYIDGEFCYFEALTNTTLPIYLSKSEVEVKKREYAGGTALAISRRYVAKVNTSSTGANELEINANNYPSLRLAKINPNGELVGLPKSDSPTLNSSNTLATSKAVYDKLSDLPNAKSDSPTLNDSNTLATSKAVRDATRGSSSTQVKIGDNAEASGTYSTALGYRAEASGYRSTALGYYANATGNNSTALGYYANATGNNSTALGYHAKASGEDSTAVGRSAKALGTSSTALGYWATASGSYSTALGYNANVSTDSTMVLGDSNTTVKLGNGNVVTSDERDKIDIADNELGLDFVKQIKTRKWRGNNRDQYWIREKVKEKREGAAEEEEREVFKTDEKGERVYDAKEHAKGSKAGKRWHRGVVSQEMLKLIDPMVFSGVKDTEVNNPDINHQEMGFAYDQLIAPMIKAIQELSTRMEEKQTQVQQQKTQIEQLLNRIEQLEK